MLGDRIGEASGTVAGMRVLSADGDDSRVEVSFRGSGQLFDVPFSDMGTFVQATHPCGILHADKANVIMLVESGEVVSFDGFGVGKPTGDGMASNWGAAGFVQTSSEKLARLNAMATVAEFAMDANGGYHWQLWEWKGPAG